MTKVYALAGLGADIRLYRNIELPSEYELVPVNWIPPNNCQSIAEYAALMKGHFHFQESSIFMGVSFGGMIAQELAHLCNAKSLILISTITDRGDLPILMKSASDLRIHKFLTKDFLNSLAWLGDKFTSKSREGRELFYSMLKESDPELLTFGAKAILKWNPPGIDVPFVRIHGSRDKVFPLKKNWGAAVIKDGNHFMIFDKGAEISQVINDWLLGT